MSDDEIHIEAIKGLLQCTKSMQDAVATVERLQSELARLKAENEALREEVVEQRALKVQSENRVRALNNEITRLQELLKSK